MKIKRRSIQPARIEMLPLIDVMFLLLVFFIYAILSMAVQHGMKLDLPASSQVRHTPQSPINVSLRRNVEDTAAVELFVNKKRVALEDLGQTILTQMDAKPDTPVLIFADSHINYQQLFQVLDELKHAGIVKISLQAKRE